MKTNLEIIAELKKEDEEFGRLGRQTSRADGNEETMKCINARIRIRRNTEKMVINALNFGNIPYKEFIQLTFKELVSGLAETPWELYQLAIKCEKEAGGDFFEYRNLKGHCDLDCVEDWVLSSRAYGLQFYEDCIKEYIKKNKGLHVWLDDIDSFKTYTL